MTRFIVGVDGGTTKTIALIADDQGHILGAGRGGTSNWTGPDVERPMRVVAETVQQARRQAGLSLQDLELGVFALAGADWPEDYERREKVLRGHHLARQIIVKNDALAGWRAGTRQRYGVGIVAGSSSNTCITAPDGREYCFGYYVVYGGAVDMGQEALYAVLRAEDGRGAPTQLSQVVLKRLGYLNPEQLLKAMVNNEIGLTPIMALCPLIFAAADSGDEVACEIVIKQGLALAEYAAAAIRRFKMQALEFDVVLSGSLFKGQGSLLVDTITQAIHRSAPRTRIVKANLEPAVGAVLLAYDALGLEVTEEIMKNLLGSAPGPAFYSTLDGGKVERHPRKNYD